MTTTRYVVEIDHQNEPVDGELLSMPALMSSVLSLTHRAEEDDIDVGVTGVRVSKAEPE